MLSAQGATRIDYLSVDVEGAEPQGFVMVGMVEADAVFVRRGLRG